MVFKKHDFRPLTHPLEHSLEWVGSWMSKNNSFIKELFSSHIKLCTSKVYWNKISNVSILACSTQHFPPPPTNQMRALCQLTSEWPMKSAFLPLLKNALPTVFPCHTKTILDSFFISCWCTLESLLIIKHASSYLSFF